jgi:hypothetical protein
MVVRQAMEEFGERSSYATAENPDPGDTVWLNQQWESARLRCGSLAGRFELIQIGHWGFAEMQAAFRMVFGQIRLFLGLSWRCLAGR